MENISKRRSPSLYSPQSFVACAWSGILKNDIMFQVEESSLSSILKISKAKDRWQNKYSFHIMLLDRRLLEVLL